MRQARQERNADREIRQRDLAPVHAVVERDGAAVDLDVVERERRRGRVRGLEQRVDQVLDVVGAVGVAGERDRGVGEPYGVEDRRETPERRRGDVEVERIETEQRFTGRAMGQREIGELAAQRERIEFDLAERRLASGGLRRVRLELRLDERRDGEEAQDRKHDDEGEEPNRSAADPAGPRRAGRCGVGIHALTVKRLAACAAIIGWNLDRVRTAPESARGGAHLKVTIGVSHCHTRPICPLLSRSLRRALSLLAATCLLAFLAVRPGPRRQLRLHGQLVGAPLEPGWGVILNSVRQLHLRDLLHLRRRTRRRPGTPPS